MDRKTGFESWSERLMRSKRSLKFRKEECMRYAAPLSIYEVPKVA